MLNHIPSVSISKQLGHKLSAFLEKEVYCGKDYDGNSNYVMSKLGVGSLRFSKQTDRDNQFSIYKKASTPEIHNYEAMLNGYGRLGHLAGRVPSVQFHKQIPRTQAASKGDIRFQGLF